MYTLYFLIGFVTSFGWWSAGKIQKAIDNAPVVMTIETKEIKDDRRKETSQQK
jgi:hypothetical protein